MIKILLYRRFVDVLSAIGLGLVGGLLFMLAVIVLAWLYGTPQFSFLLLALPMESDPEHATGATKRTGQAVSVWGANMPRPPVQRHAPSIGAPRTKEKPAPMWAGYSTYGWRQALATPSVFLQVYTCEGLPVEMLPFLKKMFFSKRRLYAAWRLGLAQ